MKLERYALIAEIVGGIGIVLSLIFVGYEVRQNGETNVQTLTQAMVSDYMDAVVALSDTPQMACIFSRAVQDYDSVSGSERAMFNVRILSVMSAFQEILVLYEQGAIDPSIWGGFKSIIEDSVEFPGLRQWWSIRRHFFGDDFREYLDEVIATTPVTAPTLYEDPTCTASSIE